ncbi:MAG: FAD-dependent oxidoreductase [Kiritimatiellae bacterium]|nr:FAD-dependent oxidoreductase [Kiritimatiellia bacterium]
MHDIVVIGGGPAGMTAALYAQRNGKSALVLERATFGGQITHSPKVENIPGFAQISGNEFADKFLEQILAQGAEVEFENATGISRREDGSFAVKTAEGTSHECRAVVLATGVKHRLPGLPGEEELVGNGISFCAVCDGDFYAGRTVCVAGGGNSGLQEAMLLSSKCRKVIILQDLPRLTGERKLQDALSQRFNVEVLTGVRIVGYDAAGGDFKGVKIEDAGGTARTVAADGLFVAIGLIPENGPFEGLAALDERGYFASAEDCATKTPGVFVAGDCRAKAVRQVATAAADGATAALAACRYLDCV